MSTDLSLTTPPQKPINSRWLWGLRIATLSLLVITSVAVLPNLAEWDESGPVVLWALVPVLVVGLLLWGLRSNPPSKFCLACIVAIGSVLFAVLGFALFLATTGPMARSARAEGEDVSVLLPAALALGGGACAALAIRIYYLLRRAPGDYRILFRVFALVVVCGLIYVSLLGDSVRERLRALEQNAVVGLQLINTAEMEYSKIYGHGFSPTLEALGAPPPGTPPSAMAATLHLPALGEGIRLGYRFTYTPGKPDSQGHIATYSLIARPLRYRRGTRRSFYTDQTGVIRFTKMNREAVAQDAPFPSSNPEKPSTTMQ